MHPNGFLILITPLLGLFTILRGGKWNWNVAKRLIGDDSPWDERPSCVLLVYMVQCVDNRHPEVMRDPRLALNFGAESPPFGITA